MWVLTTDGPEGEKVRYSLYAGQHEIGRSGPKPDKPGCDGWISFPGGADKSISRSHAIITVKPAADPHALDQRQFISIRDRSKFGVSIDVVDQCYREKSSMVSQASQHSVKQIQKDIDVPIQQGCNITVGVNNSRLRLEWEDFVIGAQISKHWSDRVRVLAMHEIQMTPKLLLALIDETDIVTPAYLQAIRNRVNVSDNLPDPAARGIIWEPFGIMSPHQQQRWRNVITGELQDQEPRQELVYLYYPDFVEGFPDEYKPFFVPTERGRGIGAKMRVRATLLARRTMIFLAGDPCVNLRQYKQVCERAKAKVEFWDAAHVVEDWKKYASKLNAAGDENRTWHVVLPPEAALSEISGAVADALSLLRNAGVIFSLLDSVWKAIIKADATEIDKDEYEGLTSTQGLSLEAVTMPASLPMAPGATQQAQTKCSLADGKEPAESRKGNNKRQRKDIETSLPVSATPTPNEKNRMRAQSGDQDVNPVVISPSTSVPTEVVSQGRASKRTRVRVRAQSPEISQAPTTQSELAASCTQAPPGKQPSAIDLRSRDREKAGGFGGAEAPDPYVAAPRDSPKAVGKDAARVLLAGRGDSAGKVGEGGGGRCCDGGRSSAEGHARMRTTCRRFQVEDDADPEGWVVILSDGPAPSLSKSAMVSEQSTSGGGAGGALRAATGNGSIVNFKRFYKKSDCDRENRSSRQGDEQPHADITFEVWPRRPAARGGCGGSSPGERSRQQRVNGGKSSATSRRRRGSWSDDSE